MERIQDTKQRLGVYFRDKFPQRQELSVAALEQLTAGVSRDNYQATLSWREGQVQVSENLVFQVELGSFHDPERYDFRRQYDVLRRVHGTGIPVPRFYWIEEDSTVFGHPFAVMEKVDGEVIGEVYKLQPQHQAQLVEDYIEILARLHELDWQSLGLSFLNQPEVEGSRFETTMDQWQLSIGSGQYDPQPLIVELATWLKRNVPVPERTVLCHGDYHLRNFLARDGRIVAILDWESVCIGDPMRDLGWSCVFLSTVYSDFCSDADFIRTYEERTGLKVNQESLTFWKVWAAFGLIAVGLAAIKIGLEAEQPDMRQLGIWSMLVPRLQDTAAQLLGF